MKLQLFNFNKNEIRIIKDEQGNPWFCGKDACRALTVVDHNQALGRLDPDERGRYSIPTPRGGNQKMIFVNESGLYSLIFTSDKPEAKVFKKWVTSDVLPTLRKTGTYSLRSLILPEPTKWEHTFPHEFMRHAMSLYGYTYDPSKGTPQFIGHFINKYVYKTLDKQMTKELKVARDSWKGEKDEVAFLHQFLNNDGRDGLRDHLLAIVPLMAVAGNIDQFDRMFEKVYVRGNQLEMYLR